MPSRLVTLFVCLIALCVIAGPASAAPKKAMFRFSATTYSVPENAGTFNVKVVRSGNTSVAASVKIAVDPSSTASSPADYSVTTGTLSFAAGQTTQTVPVTIVDNAVANPNKTVVFKLSNATPAGAQIKTTTSTLTIIDNEGPGTLDFSSNGYTVVESAGLATITVNRIGATNLALSVDYQTQAPPLSDPNPAATLGSDYSAASATLTFNPGDTSKTFQVPITDDSNAESAEDIGLRLLNPHNLSGGVAPQIGPNSPALLTINDDDVSTFSFASSLFSVNENDASGQATITVNRGGATNIASSVDYATSDGTATAGSDYTATSGTLNFAAGETTKTFTVPVANDGVSEANETVDLTLSQNGSPVATSELSIVDNDNPKASVQFSDVAYSIGEAAGTASITVTLNHAVDADVTVNYATSDGTATAGSDYTATNGTLTFLGNTSTGGHGETSKTITVPITNDPDPEDNETINLALSGAAPSTAVLAGDPSTATLTIVDDDPPGNFEFESLSYNGSETGGQAVVTVHRVGGANGATSVDYATSDGSATAGSDYTATSGTLNFASGETEKSFVVPIAWDGRGEGTETINLALSNPAGGSDLAANTAAVIRIADDGASGPAQFSASGYSVNEADGSVTITVTRSGGSLGGPVSVDYATSDGSATAGSDYTAASGTLTFGPGETTKSFTVPILNDTTHEDGESFTVTLSNPGGGTSLGGQSSTTVAIADDDAATGGPQSTPANPNPAGSQTAARDKTAPKLTLSAKAIQKAFTAKLLALRAKCNENCKLAASAAVVMPGKAVKGRKPVVLGRASARVARGKVASLKIKLSKTALAKLAKMLKAGKVKVTITVVAADAAGNKRTGSRVVTIKR